MCYLHCIDENQYKIKFLLKKRFCKLFHSFTFFFEVVWENRVRLRCWLCENQSQGALNWKRWDLILLRSFLSYGSILESGVRYVKKDEWVSILVYMITQGLFRKFYSRPSRNSDPKCQFAHDGSIRQTFEKLKRYLCELWKCFRYLHISYISFLLNTRFWTENHIW